MSENISRQEMIDFLNSKVEDAVMLPVIDAGNEGFISNIGKTTESFLNRAANMMLHVGSSVKEIGTNSVVKEVREATSFATLNKINFIIKHGNYIVLRDTKLPIPTSLEVGFNKHITTLNKISLDFFDGFDIILDDAITFLSKMVNDPDSRTNIRIKLPTSLMTLSGKIALVDNMVKSDYGHTNNQFQTLGEYVPNLNGLLTIRKELEDPVSTFSIKKIFKANDKVLKIKNIVDAIIIQAEEDGFDTNGKVYKMIINLVDELAKYVTASGLLLNDIATSSKSFVHSVDILRDKV